MCNENGCHLSGGDYPRACGQHDESCNQRHTGPADVRKSLCPLLAKELPGWFRAIDWQSRIFVFPPLMHRHNQFQTDSKQVPGTNFDLGLQTATAMAKKLALNIKADYKCYELYAS